MTTILIVSGVILLPVIYNMVFPFKRPNFDNYFSVGQTFSSQAEEITQEIIKVVGDKIYCELKIEPGASGPSEHLHFNFD